MSKLGRLPLDPLLLLGEHRLDLGRRNGGIGHHQADGVLLQLQVGQEGREGAVPILPRPGTEKKEIRRAAEPTLTSPCASQWRARASKALNSVSETRNVGSSRFMRSSTALAGNPSSLRSSMVTRSARLNSSTVWSFPNPRVPRLLLRLLCRRRPRSRLRDRLLLRRRPERDRDRDRRLLRDLLLDLLSLECDLEKGKGVARPRCRMTGEGGRGTDLLSRAGRRFKAESGPRRSSLDNGGGGGMDSWSGLPLPCDPGVAAAAAAPALAAATLLSKLLSSSRAWDGFTCVGSMSVNPGVPAAASRRPISMRSRSCRRDSSSL